MEPMPLRVAVIEDEEPARDRLRRLLGRMPNVQLVAEAGDAKSALRILEQQAVDVLLLDIRLPELDGFALLQRLRAERPSSPYVIFVTAYPDYALQAFQARALDYVLKPVEQKALSEALERARLFIEAHRRHIPSNPATRRLAVPYRNRLILLPEDQVLSVEVQEGLTYLYTRERRYLLRSSLEQMETRLDPSRFLRISRSAIVRLDGIRELVPWFSGRFKVILEDGRELIASRERSRYLKRLLAC